MNFGEMVKERRLALGYSLRAYCAKFGEDPSNWSKLERTLLQPPEQYERLLYIGECLGYEADSPEMNELFEVASIGRGQIPKDILEDAALVEKLPLVFRSLRGAPTEEELMRLADSVRKAHAVEE